MADKTSKTSTDTLDESLAGERPPQKPVPGAEVLGEGGTISGGGRSGGALARDIASEDELKRAMERPAGATRVTGSHEKDGG